jgi:hypothetical protein
LMNREQVPGAEAEKRQKKEGRGRNLIQKGKEETTQRGVEAILREAGEAQSKAEAIQREVEPTQKMQDAIQIER